MSGKKIYLNELKLKMVKKYLEEKYSYQDIADQFYCNKCDVIKWVAAYNELLKVTYPRHVIML
ncbi:hypothetical protein EDD76_11917 [Kineothrix alysoides]|uniref:Helix-turn-helix protein n=1 Tax=Kineothrix alysoides TaxID=1469948 RepID=A0A4R1QUI8_9FIRM|nr:hypothetical protein EDD76_11917 [Kineothrix alysoides]